MKDAKGVGRALFFGCIFLYLYVFHTVIHPVYVFSGDDWTYICRGREALPLFSEWDPARIFPETVMPLVADFGVYIVKPIIGDYMSSLTVAFALFMSAMMTVYVFSVYRLIRSRFSLGEAEGLGVALLFLFFHYYCFASQDEDNLHLLYIYDIANGFYYTMPILTNLVLLLLLEKSEKDGSKVFKEPVLAGVFAFFLYIAMFSHLYCNYLLAVYSFVFLLFEIGKGGVGSAGGLVAYVRKRWLHLTILVMYIICAAMEGGGTRASNMPEKSSAFPLMETLGILAGRLYHVKKKFILICAVLVIWALWESLRQGKKNEGLYDCLCRFAACSALSLLYVILLSTTANPNYIKRMDVLFGPMFFIILAVCCCIAFLLKNHPKGVSAIPLAVFIGAFSIWSVDGRTFRGNENPAGWVALENYHIEQFVEADRSGAAAFDLELTDVYEETWMGGRIATALYKHGIISRPIKSNPVKNPELASRFHIKPVILPWSEGG